MKITATILSALAAASLVSAGKFHQHMEGKEHQIIPNAFIIEYETGANHRDIQNAINSRKIDYKVRTEYNIFNGASLTVKSNHGGASLAKVPGVKNVWHVSKHELPKTEKSKKKATDPEVTSDHHMTGVDVVHKKYKLTGKGVKVGVIDTGIDYNHPAFAAKGANKGCFARYGKNCRIAHGWDFVGDDYTGSNTPKPDGDPMDCAGHGSHVAGIIGGNALDIKVSPKPPQPFVGVAPEVTFGAYRVFGCKGSAGDDVILAAMELAFNDGMDIINMSLGGGSAYKYNPTAVLAEKLISRGMALAGAAGNDGSEGVWMVSDTGLGDKATSVASFDNQYVSYNSFTYGDKIAHPYGIADAYGKPIASPAVPASATLVPIYEKDGSLSDGCDPARYAGVNVKGKVVLVLGDVTRCKSGGRAGVAKDAGAGAILIQTTPFGIAAIGGLAGVPMGSIEFQAGLDLLATYKKNPKATFTWNKGEALFAVEGGGAPSDFSSIGIDGELRSKPDLGAPGGNILSTYPLALGGYTLMSGTSMATPYVAGAHALYMQAKHAKPHGDVIRKVFKNTATISKNYGSKTFTSAAKQGAGLINVLNAITTTTSITPDHIDLLDTRHFIKKATISIKNEGKHTETYTLSHETADAYNSYSSNNSFPNPIPVIEADYAGVSFSSKTVKIAAGKTVKVSVHFTEPSKGKASQWPIYSGFVVATPKSKNGVAVHVPYVGVKGDISKVPIIDTENTPFPAVYEIESGDLYNLPKNFKFDLNKYLPTIVTRIGSHSPDFTIRVRDAKHKFVGFINTINLGAGFGYRGRDSNIDEDTGEKANSLWVWDGTVYANEDLTLTPTVVPAGVYTLDVAAQRKFTKGSFPADYEVYEVGTITIV
ncbi:hypothetical protein EMPS_10770 [Entomortierella parvispora]|uniref:Peptidase S8/S53 domain-containing protein n=1 Tax=Entomortierella parvispora TaxID=205924 RepID=A0A9P3HKS5_9FUNG|nr:hypothetical protein EMPS_10770 [Entomortierella parvispora]